jgi:hypothetical protein
MAKGSDEKTTHWTKVFTEQAVSGLNVVAFCKKIAISKWQYYYWKRRVSDLTYNAKENHPGRLKTQDFIEVLPLDFDQKRQNKNFADAVEMKIGSVLIFFSSDTDRELFKTAVSVLIEVAK